MTDRIAANARRTKNSIIICVAIASAGERIYSSTGLPSHLVLPVMP